MTWNKSDQLYEGKAKKIYQVEGSTDYVIMYFKDDLTAFNAEKKGSFAGKGELNRNLASLIFRYLKSRGVSSHWVEDIGEREMLTKKLTIIPLEVVVRNQLAGSTAKKFNIPEGTVLEQPLVELFFKKDELGDPFLSDEQALMLQAAKSKDELEKLKLKALEINQHLKEMFLKVEIDLIDFKLEFGRESSGEILLADEITPDSCRLWDQKSGKKMDKDRFRRDLGGINEAYQEVYKRLKLQWESQI